MKNASRCIASILSTLLILAATASAGPGVAVAIVYDTSGSMREEVPSDRGAQPKYVVASEALGKIVAQIDAFAKSGNQVEAGLYRFSGLFSRGEAVPLGPWKAADFLEWLGSFDKPSGGTPLGEAVLEASKAVAASPMPRKHVVVLTDGANNGRLSIEEGMKRGRAMVAKQGGVIHYYFVAFDTNASDFNAAKKEGALVFSASDEKQLKEGLTGLFAGKILLEEE